MTCGKCDQCKAQWRRNWIGRTLAENETASETWFVTLTYDGGYDRPEAYVLTYSDVQKTFKKLRRKGFRFSYVVVGEYGGEKDRAHWHLLIFWYGLVPKARFDERHYWEIDGSSVWPHGFSFIEKPRSSQATTAYLISYMDKQGAERGEFRSSKSPSIGSRYIERIARERARGGLALFQKEPMYTVPGNPNKHGKPFYYKISRNSGLLRLACETYLEEWMRSRPYRPVPRCEAVENFIDDALNEELDCRYQLYATNKPLWDWLDGCKVILQNVDDKVTVETTDRRGFLLVHSAGAVAVRRIDEKGKTVWQSQFANAERLGSEGLEELRKGRFRYPDRLDRVGLL